MEMVFAIFISILSLALVVLITLQPRQQQSLSTDATSNLGKPSYWRSHRGLKLATLAVSIVFLLSLFLYMMVVQAQCLIEWIKRSWYSPTSFKLQIESSQKLSLGEYGRQRTSRKFHDLVLDLRFQNSRVLETRMFLALISRRKVSKMTLSTI